MNRNVLSLLAALLLGGVSLISSAQSSTPPATLASEVDQVVRDMNRTVLQAAKLRGKPAVAQIACTPDFFSCTCSNAIDCAWLSWFCAEAGGITGFDNECFLPAAVPGAKVVATNAKRVAGLAGKP